MSPEFNPEDDELSRWVLENVGHVEDDFPKQVLELLKKYKG